MPKPRVENAPLGGVDVQAGYGHGEDVGEEDVSGVEVGVGVVLGLSIDTSVEGRRVSGFTEMDIVVAAGGGREMIVLKGTISRFALSVA